jgi:predicted permease
VVACKYGGHGDDIPVLLRRTLLAPPLWVLILSLSLNLGGAPISQSFLHGVLLTGQMLILLVPLAMGLLVSAAGMARPEVIAAVALRSGFGALAGLTLGMLFGLTGSAAHVAVIGAAAPIGFTAVVLSAREGLDLDLAASAAAISVFLGSLWIPAALMFV